MVFDLKKHMALKDHLAKIRQATDRAQGALDQILIRLSKELGCKSLDEANTLMEQLNQDAEAIEKKYAKALKALEEEFGDLLPTR